MKKALKAALPLGVFMAFFLLFTPIGAVRYVAAFLLSATAAALLYRLAVPVFIGARRIDATVRGVKLSEIQVAIEITNRSPFPVPEILLCDAPSGEITTTGTALLASLGPFGRKTVVYTLRGHKRGTCRIGPIALSGTDPFGLFPWTRRVKSFGEVVVYPSISALEFVHTAGFPAGNLKVSNRLYEDVTQFRSLREYVAGDDMKRINWKASARTGRLYTTEYDATLYFPVLVALDFCIDDYPMRYREELLERAADAAASAVFAFTSLKQSVGFLSTGRPAGQEEGFSRVEGKNGYEHAQQILESIARLQPVKGNADYTALFLSSGARIPSGSRVVLIAPPAGSSQAESLIACSRRGMRLEVLRIDPLIEKIEDALEGAVKVTPVSAAERGVSVG